MTFEVTNLLVATNTEQVVGAITGYLFNIAVIVVPILVTVAALMFLFSGGSPEKIATAKKLLIWTVVGFALVMLAQGVYNIIKALLG